MNTLSLILSSDADFRVALERLVLGFSLGVPSVTLHSHGHSGEVSEDLVHQLLEALASLPLTSLTLLHFSHTIPASGLAALIRQTKSTLTDKAARSPHCRRPMPCAGPMS